MIRRALLIVLSIIPGVGPIWLGREWLGALLLVVGLNAWNMAFLGFFFLITDPQGMWGWLGLVVGLGASGFSVVWTAVVTSPARCRRCDERAARAHRIALMSLLRGRQNEARVAVESGLQARPDDTELRFLSWYLQFTAAGPRAARASLRRLRRVDRDEKWIWETRREEELRDRA